MVGNKEPAEEGGLTPQEAQAAADRESELRLQRLDLWHAVRIRLMLSNEQLEMVKQLKIQIEGIDDELAGQQSFFDRS